MALNYDGYQILVPSIFSKIKCSPELMYLYMSNTCHIFPIKLCCLAHHNIWSCPLLTQHGGVGELGFTHLLFQPCWCWILSKPHTMDLSWFELKSQHAYVWFLQVFGTWAFVQLGCRLAPVALNPLKPSLCLQLISNSLLFNSGHSFFVYQVRPYLKSLQIRWPALAIMSHFHTNYYLH